jgi:N-acetylglucosaminyldiphosphoundecaprenol N-acetyl-beta-D-mannosaminyltransferase
VDAETPVSAERISLLKVPLDIVSPEGLSDKIQEILAGKENGKNIVLLSLWDLLRARRVGEYRSFVLGAALVIPISKSLVGGVRFLRGKTPVRYMPFDFIINLLSILEKRELSLYILGGKLRILKKAEKNIRQTFPGLRVVGRYPGTFKRHEEGTLLQAIRKASPSLLLVGKGVHGEERWIAKNNALLSPGLRLWCSDIFDVFSERKKRPSRSAFDRGLEWIGFCFQNPLRFFRIFPYFYYKFLLLIYRLFRLG